jgi:hypothetical protein
MKRIALVCVVATIGLMLAAQPALASWGFQNTPNLGTGTVWNMGAVACTSSSVCMAVGDYSGSGGSGLLAETRSGDTWTVEPSPTAPGPSGRLLGISCTSATACIAVGSTGPGGATLADSWNGATWTTLTTPNPAGSATAELTDVRCTAAAACIAVGDSSDGVHTTTLAESWNGTSWSIQSTANPAGATTSTLSGIACTSGTACIAVGDSVDGPDTTTLAESWSGTSWSIQSTPNPAGSTLAELSGVSCSSAGACTAVGTGLAERWNGTTWFLQTVKDPHGDTGGGADLLSVGCPTATSCEAVGVYYLDAVQTAVAESWDGSKWAIQSVPIDTANDSSALSGVVCTGATACTAVGSYHNPLSGNRALAEVFALVWQVQLPPVPFGTTSSLLHGVACPSPTACQSVGSYYDSSDTDFLIAEGWDGTSWTTENPPDPPGGSSGDLNGVACTSPKACTAVGYYYNGTHDLALAERWDGTAWTAQTPPNPSGATLVVLQGVACPTAKVCTAVGYWINGSGTHFTLAESWNGTAWAIQSTPNPTGTLPQLNGASCTAATACTAVGLFDNSLGRTEMLAERWNGTTWAIQSTPDPAGGFDSSFQSVSCPSTTLCTAVGSYVASGKSVPLAETWDGTAWTNQNAAIPHHVRTTALFGVSCPSTKACVAVGYDYPGSESATFAESWNGKKWVVQMAGVPFGAQRSLLLGASCSSPVDCMAAGWFTDASGTDTLFTEQYS